MINDSKWLLLTTVAVAGFAFAAPAQAQTPQVPGTIVVAADDTMVDEGEMGTGEEVAPETSDPEEGPVDTTSEPEGRMDEGEMESGNVAPETSTDDTPAQAADPDAVEEMDGSMENEEVGDPTTD